MGLDLSDGLDCLPTDALGTVLPQAGSRGSPRDVMYEDTTLSAELALVYTASTENQSRHGENELPRQRVTCEH